MSSGYRGRLHAIGNSTAADCYRRHHGIAAHAGGYGGRRRRISSRDDRPGPLCVVDDEDLRVVFAGKGAVLRAEDAGHVDARGDNSRNCYLHLPRQGDAGRIHKQKRRHQTEGGAHTEAGSLMGREAGVAGHKFF